MNIVRNMMHVRRLFPQKTALKFENQSWSYAELDDLSNRIANVFRDLGMKKGDRIALFLPNIPEFAFSYLGILKIGGIAVSLNSSLKSNEVKHILDDSGSEIVITTEALRDEVPSNANSVKHVLIAEGRTADDHCLHDLIKTASSGACLVNMNRQDPAAILYTSGTTGASKGATLSHGNILSNMYSFNYNCGMTRDDRMLLYLPLFHCFGQNAIMNSCFNVGATLVLQRFFKPEEVHRAIVDEQITMFFGVPTTFPPICDRVPEEDMQSVRYSFSAAAILPLEIANRWRDKYAMPVYEGYGLTETSPFASYNHILEFRPGSIGIPIENVEMKVVDENGNETPPGELGEIVISGPNVMLGYWNKPGETAKVLKNGWFHSGDIGRMDEDGYFFIVDRKKDMINVGGLKVYPAEVEHVLYQHEAVNQAAVYAAPDPTLGERVWANIVLEKDQDVSVEDIAAFCRARIASFKVPSEIRFVTELPKNPVGKLLKRVLREEASKDLGLSEEQQSPRVLRKVEAEQIRTWLTQWLFDKLNVKPEEIQAHKSFLDYGIDSILALDLSDELGHWLGLKLEPIILWNFSSIQSLTDRLMVLMSEPQQTRPEVAADDLEDLSDEEMARLLSKELATSQEG